jgi:midasin (ATPase involved in ribosome maturation)
MMEIRPKKSRKPESESRPAQLGWEAAEVLVACPVVVRLYLWGPPGVGKTWFAYHRGGTERGVYAITCTPETPASELRGHFMPQPGGGFEWHDGPVVRALREGALLVINEITHASDDVFSFLLPLLEYPETARVTLPSNETVRPAPGFRCIATANVSPDELPPALRDRFDAVLELREPHPEALAQLSESLREVARRGFALDGGRSLSLRGWLALDRLRHVLGLERACAVTFGPERGAQIHDAIVLAGGC